MNVVIGIDVGTQGTKAIAYLPASPASPSAGEKNRGQILARASAGYSLLPTDVAGRAEQDPEDWIDAVRSVLKTLVADLGLAAPPSSPSSASKQQYFLSGIGVSGQQHGMVLLDSDYRTLRPAKLWCDVEASDESHWIRTAAAAVDGGAGRWDHIVPSFTSPKVLWTMKNEPEIWERVRWCVLPHDYVNLVLRGVRDDESSRSSRDDCEEMTPSTDRGDASGSGVFDPASNQYCMELVNAIDSSGRYAKSLPKILDPLDICGNLSMQWIKDIGLLDDSHVTTDKSNIPFIPISVGSGDNMCSAMGVGCVEPGMAVLSLGTSGTIFGVSRSPPSSRVSPFADACGNYLPLACVMSCTGVLNSVLDSFFNGCDGDEDHSRDVDAKGRKKKITHNLATEMASFHPPGCHGITFLPYLTPGERTPNWPHASGTILGLTASNMSLAVRESEKSSFLIDKEYTSPASPMAGLLYRAAMEGITYLLAESVLTMQQACGDGFRPERMLVVGGGSRNRLWRQMLADVLRVELRFPKESDSAALGAAFQAGAAVAAARGNGGGKKKHTIEEYILEQSIEMENEVILPSSDEQIATLYREGREQYCRYAAKLFGNEII